MLSQSEGLEADGSTETQYTYYPATIADATTGTMVTTVQASDTLLGQTTPTGSHCPYMMPGTDLCHSAKTKRLLNKNYVIYYKFYTAARTNCVYFKIHCKGVMVHPASI